jgi:hypothetical protein
MIYRMSPRSCLNLLLAPSVLICAVLFTGCGSNTPSADGVTLHKNHCASCHSGDRGLISSKTREEWQKTIERMIHNGVKLSEADKAALLDYLAATTSRVSLARR